MNNKIQQLEKLANDLGGRIYRGYSGRGMFGKSCVGIVCEDATECIESAAGLGIRGAKTDNMGKRMIVYWPSISDDEEINEA
jgi:hypothetical protein